MPPSYHCHKCNKHCQVVTSYGTLRCTQCNEGFVESVEDISDYAEQDEVAEIPSTSTANLMVEMTNNLISLNQLIDEARQQLEAKERIHALQPEDIQRIAKQQVTQTLVNDDAKCIICMESFVLGEVVTQLDCEHIFHRPCIQPWFQCKNTCPMCREEVDPSKWPPATSTEGGGKRKGGGAKTG